MSIEDRSSGLVLRRAAELVDQALLDTPVVVIQGARQVGKSTLARQVLAGRGIELVNLDIAAERDAARRDPDAFVRRRVDALMAIDEVQRVPELLLAVKGAVDEERRPGRFLLTGSANLVSMRRSGDSLAGRAETVSLYGLSQGEINGGRDALADLMLAGDERPLADMTSSLTRLDYMTLACAGSFPEARLRTGRRRTAWFDNYVQRIVTRDARDLSSSPYLDRLPRLIAILAANNSGELVKTRIAVDSGIPETTLPGYIDLLVDMFLIQVVAPFSGNLRGRVVGRPKVSFLDTGLAARLSNLSPEALDSGSSATHAGPLLEALVTGELRRQQTWAETAFELLHFRDRNGHEVDLILEDSSRRVVGFEVKAASRIRPGDQRGLELLRDSLGDRFVMGAVLYTGNTPIRIGDRLWALPVSSLWQ